MFINKINPLNIVDYEVLLKVLEELKHYTEETGLVKKIDISCDELRDELRDLKTSESIDEIIEIVEIKINNNKNDVGVAI